MRSKLNVHILNCLTSKNHTAVMSYTCCQLAEVHSASDASSVSALSFGMKSRMTIEIPFADLEQLLLIAAALFHSDN